MQILEIALALSVSMLIFSSISAMIVDFIHRIVDKRAQELQKMLERFYDDEVKLFLDKENDTPELRKQFVETIRFDRKDTTITTTEFIRRLAKTEVGKKIGKLNSYKLAVTIKDLTEKFEEYGKHTSLLFKEHSRNVNSYISIVLALTLNLNVILILEGFKENETLTQSLVMQAERFTTQYDSLKNKDMTKEQEESYQQNLKEIKIAIEDAQGIGLPIGWSKKPHTDVCEKGLFCSAKKVIARMNANISNLNIFLWLITTVITGLLIGMGAPFWYEMIKKLTPMTRLAGALTKGTAQANKDTALDSTTGEVIDPVEEFKSSLEAHKVILAITRSRAI